MAHGKLGYRADIAFDGEQTITGGALVLVEDGVIIGVEPGSAPAPDGWQVTYLPGTTMLPGLIEAHSHVCGNGQPDALDRLPGLSPDELDEAVEAALRAQLAVGVTAVRDLGDHQWAVVDRHRKRPDGPTVVAAGPPLTSVGGHCASMGGEASGVGELRRAVRERADRGADLVKIMTSGGVMTASTDIRACQFTLEELAAVVDEAHRLGLPVTAHAHALAAVQQCVTAGVDGIEHCSCIGEQGMHTPPELASAIAAAGIAVCPTLGHDMSQMAGPLPPAMAAAVKRSGVTLEQRLVQVGELHRGGVTLVSGVDSGIHPLKAHGTLPLAVIELAVAGALPTTALASATGLAARACGLADRTGRLRTGLDADLLLVDGDPTTDITAIRNLRTVVSRGQATHPNRTPDPPSPAAAQIWSIWTLGQGLPKPAHAAVRAAAEPVAAANAIPGLGGGVMLQRRLGIHMIPGDRQGRATVTEHPNVELTRRGYEAFAKGDVTTLSELIADDVTWHVTGAGPLTGTYHGRDEVFGFFGRLAGETGSTFRLDVHDVLANDEHAVALCTLSASRGGKSIEVPVANVSHVRDGKVTEFWGATTDPQASIDFWS